jgi:hypothetical protein
LSAIKEKEFERIIDCIEKVAFMYKTINVDFISSKFYEHADENLHSIKKSLIYHIID